MRSDVFPSVTPLVREPNTPTEWLTRTELYVFANLPHDAVEAGRAMLNSTAEDGSGATPAQVARALQLIIASLIQLDQTHDLAGLVEQRETALRADGRDAQADLEKRVGMALFGAPTDEDMITLAEEIERLEATPGAELADVELTVAAGLLQRAASSDESQAPAADAAERALDLLTRAVHHSASCPTLQVSALLGLSHARTQLGGLEAALEPVTRALDLSRDLPGLRPGLLRHRASIYGGLGRFEEGAVDADEAVALLLRHGLARVAVGASALAADLYQDAGAPKEAVLRLRRALREAEQSGMPTLALRYRLGVSLTEAGQPAEAAETLNHAWDLIKDTGGTDQRVRVLEVLAFAKGKNKDPSGLADIDRCIELVGIDVDGSSPWKLADLTDSKARILIELEDFSQAAACFLTASDGFRACEDWSSAVGTRHMAAQLLAGPGNKPSDAIAVWQEALVIVDQATAAGEDLSELRSSILTKLADTLDSQGRTSEAAQARATPKQNPT